MWKRLGDSGAAAQRKLAWDSMQGTSLGGRRQKESVSDKSCCLVATTAWYLLLGYRPSIPGTRAARPPSVALGLVQGQALPTDQAPCRWQPSLVRARQMSLSISSRGLCSIACGKQEEDARGVSIKVPTQL